MPFQISVQPSGRFLMRAQMKPSSWQVFDKALACRMAAKTVPAVLASAKNYLAL